MTRTLLAATCLALAGVLMALGFVTGCSSTSSAVAPDATPDASDTSEKLEPIQSDARLVTADTALPQGAVAVDLAAVAQLEPPFTLAADATAAGGMALVLPKGTREKDRSSQARIPFQVSTSGSYYVWLRAFWRDGCGNSVFAKIADAPEKTVGHDELFNVWHWIPAGEFSLKEGAQELVLREREDGIALDQLLLVRDKDFLPTGRVEKTSFTRSVRRFADDFTRSPGHGLGDWEKVSGRFDILFSFDPNRIPLQYAFNGQPDGEKPAIVLVKGPPWTSARLRFSVFPTSAGTFGVLLDRSADGQKALHVDFSVAKDSAGVAIHGVGADLKADLCDRLRLNQWHAVTIERWAWILSVYLDETLILTRTDLPTPLGNVGLSVSAGSTVFDDVKLEELPWQADDGQEARILWKPIDGAAWFRHGKPETGKSLLGRSGGIATSLPPLSIHSVFLDEQTRGSCSINAEGLEEPARVTDARILRHKPFVRSDEGIALHPLDASGTELKRIAVAYREPVDEELVVGPYTFSEYTIPDPSDYIDFTPEEHAQMRNLPEGEKFRRGEKPKQVIGHRNEDNSPWYTDRGRWRLRDKHLEGIGPALLNYADDFGGAFEMRLKVFLPDAGAVGQVFICGDPGKPHELNLVAQAPAQQAAESNPFTLALATNVWRAVRIRVSNAGLDASVDGGEWRHLTSHRGDAGAIALAVISGRVDFDDIEFVLPRVGPDGRNYGFMQAEADWWREANNGAQWVDHGGISCRLASSWISLLAPTGRGFIWNKHTFGSDIAIASDITENSEWYGWDHQETHQHFPYDNICLVLGSEYNENKGYRLEVNAQSRSATVLYRDNQPVARVAQDHQFPMRFVNSHYPYYPRRNRVELLKRGNQLVAIVDGQVVLSFTDPEPLPVSRIGFGGYQTHINFGPIHVRQLEQE